MKKIVCCVLFLLLCLVFSSSFAETLSEISLHSGWVFQKGDNIDWKEPAFDDRDWMSINPTGYWDYIPELEGYDGYGWYRIKVFIPSSMKEGMSKTDSLHVRLGRADDNDQTYLNGILIGENARNTSGEGDPKFAGEELIYSRNRNYTLPLNHPAIKWDAVNVIAVRVYDFYLTGGLTVADHRLYVKKGWTDDVTFSRESSYLSGLYLGKPLDVTFSVNNASKENTYDIRFFAEITLKESGKSIATFTEDLKLAAGGTVRPAIQFTPYIATDYELMYRITDQETGFTMTAKDILGFFLPDVKLLETPLQPVVKDKVPVKYAPLAFSEMHIDGYLAEKMALNLEKGLLNIPYQQMAPHLDGIEPPWPVGEFIGKLLHGNTKYLQYDPDQRLFETTTSVIEIWRRAQKEDGYIGTNLPEEQWEGWDVWDHKYLILAFVHYYAITGYEPALDAAKEIGDLMVRTFGYKDGQRDLMLGYHNGMASGSILEPMVYLYKYTAEEKYLEFCRYIMKAYEQENGPHIVSELTEGSKTVLKVGNAKGYEMMSCLIGIIQLYKVTGEEKLIKAILNAWDDIAANRLYITGTSTSYEHFKETGYLPADERAHMGEGCVTSHWMYLSKELFKLFGDPKYLDEIEKSLYNHLLAAQHPISGDVVYYSAYQHQKWYMIPDMYIGPPLCCHFSVKRCITEIPEVSFYKKDKELGVLLYNPSSFETAIGKRSVAVEVESNYPYQNEATIRINPDKKTKFTLKLRVPAWCAAFTAEIEGELFEGKPGEYLALDRKWSKGDEVKISMDFPLTALEGGKSYPDHFALKYGNQVLAVDGAVNGIRDLNTVVFDKDVKPALKPYTGEMPDQWIGKQAFVTNAMKTDDGKSIILVPYADASQTGGDIRVWIPSKKM